MFKSIIINVYRKFNVIQLSTGKRANYPLKYLFMKIGFGLDWKKLGSKKEALENTITQIRGFSKLVQLYKVFFSANIIRRNFFW